MLHINSTDRGGRTMKRFTLEQLVPDTINLLIPEQDGVCFEEFFYISFDQTNERGIRDERNDESQTGDCFVGGNRCCNFFIMFHFRQLTFMQQKPGNLFFLILAVLFVLYIVRKAKIAGQSKIELSFIKEYTGLKIGVIVFLLFLAVYVAGSILSSPIVNAAKYQKLFKSGRGGIYRGYQTDFL